MAGILIGIASPVFSFVPPVSFLKIKHWSVLVKGMGPMGAMKAIRPKMAVLVKENAQRPNVFSFHYGKRVHSSIFK